MRVQNFEIERKNFDTSHGAGESKLDMAHQLLDSPQCGTPETTASDGIARWRRCLGLSTIAIVAVTIPLNLVILGFISFLWRAGSHNAFWHTIMIRNWATRAVTIPSLLLRSFGDLQAGAATAMIAALVR